MKFISAAISFTMLSALVLEGCGSSPSASSGQSSNSSGSKGVTLTLMDAYTTDTQSAAMEAAIKSFQQSNPTIKIERTKIPYNSLLPKALQEAASHSLPDLLVLDNPNLQAFASTGALKSLDDFGTIDTSQYFKGSLSTVTYNNKLYGLPIGNNDLALFYNNKMFEQAHLTPPKTWDELLTDAKSLTHGSTYGLAISAPNGEECTWQFEPFLWTNGGEVQQIDSPQAKQALDLWVKLMQGGTISKSAMNWSQADVSNQFVQGHAAMMINGPFAFPILDKASGLDYGIVPIPVPSSDKQPISPLGGHVMTIPASTPEKEKAAWTFLKWFQDPTNLVSVDKALGYIPAYLPAAEQMVKDQSRLQIFADELKTGRARTAVLGTNYPKVSEAVWTAIQSALAGTQSPDAAVKEAQSKIDQIVKK